MGVATDDDGAGAAEDEDARIGWTKGGGEAGVEVVAGNDGGVRENLYGKGAEAGVVGGGATAGKAEDEGGNGRWEMGDGRAKCGEELGVGGEFEVEGSKGKLVKDAAGGVGEERSGFGAAAFDG